MDFKGVNLVLNYDFPPTAISYIHRIGEATPTRQTLQVNHFVHPHVQEGLGGQADKGRPLPSSLKMTPLT